jgi:succinoglycan biosynthesis transport protein ExoP
MARSSDEEEGAQLPEQRIDWRRLLWLMGRQRTMVAACVLVGALLPAILVLLRSTSYTATSIVLVPSSSASNAAGGSTASGNGNVTDSELAVSSAVLGPAGSSVTPRVTSLAAQHRVSATPVATNLVQITATGSSPRSAETLANAVAKVLVDFVTSSNQSNGSSALAGLEAQAAELTKQVDKYNQEIHVEQAAIQSAPNSPIAEEGTQLLASLTTAQANAALQLQTVNSQIASAKLNSAATNGGTTVIQHASSAAAPSLLAGLLPIIIGAFLGLLIAAAIVILRQRNSRLTTRDEIAAVAGVPVVLSLNVRHLARPSEWLTLLREHEPTAAEMWNVRNVLNEVDAPEVGGRLLTVITLADDSASMAAIAHLAVASAAMGIITSLVLTSDDPGSRGLSDACDLLTARSEAARPNLRLFKGSSSVDEAESALTFISIVLNPDEPKFPAFVARGMVMIAISAGSVDQEQLSRVLIAVGQEGLSIRGLVVTNPMRGDTSLGSLPNASEQVTRFLQRRALEPWTGRADVR